MLAIATLLAFYAYVALLVRLPHVDEAYRRTFLTGEFLVYPTSDSWKPGGGLDYPVGTYIDFHRGDMRNWLARPDWTYADKPIVTLRGTTGRLFFHLTGGADAAKRRHKLTLWFACHLPTGEAGDLDVSVNGLAVAAVDCGEGPAKIEADLPAGSLGVQGYDEIALTRAEGSLIVRIATRFGFRAQAVELVGMEVDAE
jgi:hypothetical protein